MLLQRLVEYAGRDGAVLAFHRERLFDWLLALDADGHPEPTLLSLVVQDARDRLRGVAHQVPTMVRTVGVAANLAADDAQYVLGWADEDSKPARIAQCHAAFVDLTRRWAESGAGRDDPVARAVDAFYRSGAAAGVGRPDGCTAKSGVLITVGGIPAYRSSSVPAFWAEEVARRKGSAAGNGLCLACGQVRPLLDTLPGKVPSRLVPGSTNDTALVSVNERVFGYDLNTQLAASPLCISCGEAVTAGLVRALSSEHSSTYGGQDSRFAWWITKPSGFDAMAMMNKPSGEQVTALLESVHRGQQVSELKPAKFCSLTVGGNVARVVVRDWLEMPLAQLERHVASWYRPRNRLHSTGRLRVPRDRAVHAGVRALAARPQPVRRLRRQGRGPPGRRSP